MANAQRLFFYAPTWDFPPGGPIKLGNVLSSVKTPHRPLHCAPPPEASDVYATTKRGFSYTREKSRSGRFSILTKFLSVIGVGVDFGAEVNNSDGVKLSCDSIETTFFYPSSSYLQNCVQADLVRDFLDRARYRKPVYVVTGLKIATGTRANTLESHAVTGVIAAQVDGTIVSGGTAPIGVGPSVTGSMANNTTIQWEGSDDFVFAFSVIKVKVGKMSGQVEHVEDYCEVTMLSGAKEDVQDYSKGAMLANEDEGTQVGRPELSVLEVKEPDADSEGFDTLELLEDQDAVLCAVPREDLRVHMQ